MAGGGPLSRPVRQAFWMVVGAAVLMAGQLTATVVLLVRFEPAYAAYGPWTVPEREQLADVRVRLLAAAVLGAGLAGVLTGAAMAVPRRSPNTRPVVCCAFGLVAVTLLLGVVFSPDSALYPASEGELAHLERLLPLWFSAVSSSVVVGVLGLLVGAALRLCREQAVEYYQRHDPTATWRGFTSWLDIARGRPDPGG